MRTNERIPALLRGAGVAAARSAAVTGAGSALSASDSDAAAHADNNTRVEKLQLGQPLQHGATVAPVVVAVSSNRTIDSTVRDTAAAAAAGGA